MKHFYFFRHGQTNENRDGKQYSTGDNAYLTETGVKQAQELAKYLSDKNLDIIYSSPFNRTIETAKIIAKKYKNLHIETNNALKDAEVETGYIVRVPLFIEEGEKIIVSTSDGKYVSRA